MSVNSLYSPDIQRAWATVFACAWAWQLKDPKNFEDEYKKPEVENHFYCALIKDPRKALEAASRGKYPCDCTTPSLEEAAQVIVNNCFVLPFPEPPSIDNLNIEQLRQFFDQEGVMGVLRFT